MFRKSSIKSIDDDMLFSEREQHFNPHVPIKLHRKVHKVQEIIQMGHSVWDQRWSLVKMAATSTHLIGSLAFSQAVLSGATSVWAVSSVANHPPGFHQMKAKCAVVTLPEGASS